MTRRSFALGCLTGLVGTLLIAGVLVLAVFSGIGGGSDPEGPTGPPTLSRVPVPSGPAPTSVGAGETWLGDVALSSSAVLTSDGPLRDVHADGTGVSLTADGLRAQRLEITATLPFETAAEQIGDGIELFPVGELAGLRRTVELLGRQLDIEATGRVSAEGGQLLIEPETVNLGSFEWIDRVGSAAVRSFVTIRHTVTGIPDGMRLNEVQVEPEGFRVDLSGSDVRIG